MQIRGDFLERTEEQLNSFVEADDSVHYWESYDGTESFRRQCIGKGFHLTHIYPMYYQGWECDQWGAIGTKDGKRFRLETNHGSLHTEELKEGFPLVRTIKTLFFGEEDAN